MLGTRETVVNKTDEVALWKLPLQMVRQMDRKKYMKLQYILHWKTFMVIWDY